MPNPILIAKNAQTELALLPALANRHGCITGATGTGKTVTLQVLAESFSRIGTPVFMADVKGDLTGVSQAARPPKLQERLKSLGLAEPAWAASPVALWDVFGEQGAPVRATISDMGPLLLARILELNDTQEGVLALVFKVADDEGQLLLDLKDLRAMLQNVADRSAELKTRYGNVSAASVGAIQRSLLTLESQGAEVLRRAHARCGRPDAHRRPGDAASSTCWPPTNSCRRRACTRSSCSGCWATCTKSCRKWATWNSPSWSSSTRPICCSPTRRKPC